MHFQVITLKFNLMNLHAASKLLLWDKSAAYTE